MTYTTTRKSAQSPSCGVSLLSACADKPGSKGWCQDMSAKNKGDGQVMRPKLTPRTVSREHHDWQPGLV